MKKIWIIIAVVVVLIFMIGGWVFGNYNAIIAFDEEVSNAWANVQSAYQRRMDLIPNLVNTVKGYAEHEEGVLTAVTEARAKASGANSVPQQMAAQNELSSALSRLMVVVEAYPDLKASQNFTALQDELAGTENRINVARNRYNEAVKQYNRKIRQFPGAMFASMFGFEKREFFEAPQEAAQAPSVEF